MKLIVGQPNPSNAVATVRWCLTPEEVQELSDKKDVFLLLFVVNNGSEVDRLLVPLNQMMEYVEFARPGKNTVVAEVIWSPNKKKSEVRKRIFLRSPDTGSYAWDFSYLYFSSFDAKKSSFRPGAFDCHCLDKAHSTVEVDVAGEFFAKEPWAIEKWWVNLWFETKPRNQCQFRRRRFLAYSIQPICVLVWLVVIVPVRFFCAWWWLLMRYRRGVNFGAIIHPFRNDTDDVWGRANNESNFLLRNKAEKARGDLVTLSLFMFLLPFNPVVVVAGIGVATLLHFEQHAHSPIWQWFLLGILLPSAVVFIVVICVFLVVSVISVFQAFGFANSLKKMKRDWGKRAEEEKKMREEEERTRMRKELENLLVCKKKKVFATIQALPPQKQTVYLRFWDLKAKICKPFAR